MSSGRCFYLCMLFSAVVACLDGTHGASVSTRFLEYLAELELDRSVIFVVNRSLVGQGFHRELVTEVAVTLSSDVTPSRCTLLLLERLPSSLYVDTYQLDQLERLCKDGTREEQRCSHVRLPYGVEMDLEKPQFENGIPTSTPVFVFHSLYVV